MKCEKDKETASRYLGDLMAADERAEFEAHLAECEDCRSEVARFRKMLVMLNDLPKERAPLSVARAIDGAASSHFKAKRTVSIQAKRSAVLRVAAAAVILLAVLSLSYLVLFPPESEQPEKPAEIPRPDSSPETVTRLIDPPRPPAAVASSAFDDRATASAEWFDVTVAQEGGPNPLDKKLTYVSEYADGSVEGLSPAYISDIRRTAESTDPALLSRAIRRYGKETSWSLDDWQDKQVQPRNAVALAAGIKQAFICALARGENPSLPGMSGWSEEEIHSSNVGEVAKSRINCALHKGDGAESSADEGTEAKEWRVKEAGGGKGADSCEEEDDEDAKKAEGSGIPVAFYQDIIIGSAVGDELTGEQRRWLSGLFETKAEPEDCEKAVISGEEMRLRMTDGDLAALLEKLLEREDLNVRLGPLAAQRRVESTKRSGQADCAKEKYHVELPPTEIRIILQQ